MGAKLIGVPLGVWGLACLALTVVWVFVWPSTKTVPGDLVRYFILRWFHALVWLLLAAAAFLAAFDVLGGAGTARVVALLSLGVYLVFMATLLTAR